MVRNHCGVAWRPLVAFLSLFFILSCPAVYGAPGISGMPPVTLVLSSRPSKSPPPATTYSLSGYVYDDLDDTGQMLPGDVGLPAVLMTLIQTGGTGGTQTLTAYTNSAGYYTFGNLVAGDTYQIQDTLPSLDVATAANVGWIQTSSGGSTQVGTALSPTTIANITFATSSSGASTGVDYNFGYALANDYQPAGLPTSYVIKGRGGVGPSASFSVTATVPGSDRFLATPSGQSGAGTLDFTGSVLNTASSGSLTWTFVPSQSIPSSGVSIVPTSGSNLAAGQSGPFTGTISGAGLANGPATAEVAISGQAGSGPSKTNVASLAIDPVYSRQIDSVSTANFGRIMQGGTATANLTITSAGAYTSFANLTMNPVSVTSLSDSNGSYTFTNTASVLYNGTTTTNSAAATSISGMFSNTASGPTTGTVSIAGNTAGLFTPETIGSVTASAPTALNIPYTATVLQQRTLTSGGTLNFTSPNPGGFLTGAIVPATYSVTSFGDSSHYTNVWVGSSSGTGTFNATSPVDGTQTGQVLVTSTTVNSAGTTNVPVQIALTGLGGNIPGTTNPPYYVGSGTIAVGTAEAASVGDTTPYNPVSLTFTANNVGWAVTGSQPSVTATAQAFGAPLEANVAKGATLATLSSPLASVVVGSGTSGVNTTYANATNFTTLYATGATSAVSAQGSTVGTQCQILDSTALPTSTTVGMAWRNRNASENGSFTSSAESLPSGVQWLTSDVVQVTGVPSGTVYAMEMSFDDSINNELDNNATATVAGSYIGQLLGTSWKNAASASSGSLASQFQGVSESLQTFLANEYSNLGSQGMTHDQILQALAGSWGVQINGVGQVDQSWAILTGDGNADTFAVVPEPSTLALLGAGLAGVFVYRIRRKNPRKALAKQNVRVSMN